MTIPIVHVTENSHVGLVKPTPKWTKVPRMECGLDGGYDTQPLPTLGNKRSAKMVGKDYMGMKETWGVKHGKL